MKAIRIALLFLVLLALQTAGAATFTVTNTAPDGPGSLAQAVTDVNAGGVGPHRIEFAIPPFDGTVKTILITNSFPLIVNPVVIDGYTQPGSSSNTLANGDAAVLLVEVTSTNNLTAFSITAGGSAVRGLAIYGLSNCVSFPGGNGGNVVEGNFLGLTASGINLGTSVGNNGVYIATTNNLVGGASPGARNVIAGNSSFGILVISTTASNNIIQGNFIGTDQTGTNAIANGKGIQDSSQGPSLIGGTNVAARNVISGNTFLGINLPLARGKLIQGNFIGVDVTGTQPLGNGKVGISFQGFTNQVGGLTATPGQPPGNVISANSGWAISIGGGGSGHIIQGNLIGTDITGTKALGNGDDAVFISGPSDVLIGGTNAGAGNVISSSQGTPGNTGSGVRILGSSRHIAVQGNWIGTDITGTQNLSNSFHGVMLQNGYDCVIGGAVGNVIAFNGGVGVAIVTAGATNNLVSANSIFANGGIGIDLALLNTLNGVNMNDLCDADSGANHLQNFPVLTNVIDSLGGLTIQGFLPSAANTTYRLEFFANTHCDPSGFGEGETFLGATNVTTDATCTNNFSVTFAAFVPCHFFVTATAIDPNGNTSEFSECRESVGLDTDGDGECDLEEVLAGTDPNNNASSFHITAIAREGNDLRVTWTCGAGRTNILQATSGSSLTNNFIDLAPQIVLTGVGVVTTNRLDIGAATNAAARYYRVRLVP